jgi:hypothetical protein
VFLAFAFLTALAPGFEGPPARRRALRAAAVATAVAAALWLLPAVLGHRPLASLATALAIHRNDYTRPRGYALWLVFNLVDLAVFIGVPVAVAWAARTAAALRHGPRDGVQRMRAATAAGLAVILLSGQTRGEVGRIWLPLMPSLLVAAFARPGGPTRGEALVCAVGLAALTIGMAVFWQVP